MSKYGTNLLEIIDFYRFASSSILHKHSENEKATVRKGSACVLVKHREALALSDETCHRVHLYFLVLVIEAVNCKLLVVNGASDVTNHNTAPHPCLAAVLQKTVVPHHSACFNCQINQTGLHNTKQCLFFLFVCFICTSDIINI